MEEEYQLRNEEQYYVFLIQKFLLRLTGIYDTIILHKSDTAFDTGDPAI